MTNTSSRVLREAEQAVVTPIAWRASTTALPPKTKPNAIAVKEVFPEQAASASDITCRSRIASALSKKPINEASLKEKTSGSSRPKPNCSRFSTNLAKLSGTFFTPFAHSFGDAEGDLLKLAISIARRVLHRELTLDPESIEGLIRVALDKLQSRELCRVRVHPDQEQAIRKSLERFSNSQKVELIADPSLQCGDVIFETAHGNLDASIESQLREIERGFADRLRRLPANR